MKRVFKPFANYIQLFDGMGKPKLNFQEMYRLFPDFTFTAAKNFGQYENFGQAFGHKKFPMVVTDNAGNECFLTYQEYQDANENAAYVS